MSTEGDDAPLEPGESRPPAATKAPRHRQWRRSLLIALVLVIVGGLIASTVYHLDQLALGPGEALPVTGPHGLISVPPHRSHSVRGRILLTTVSVSPVRAIDWVFDKLNSNVSLVPVSEVYGDLSSSQFQQYDTAAMTLSQQAATVVALRQLGYQVQEHQGATIVQVAAGSPAAKGGVPLGGVLVAVDGQPVTSAAQAVAAIGAHRPGEEVRLTIERSSGGAPTTVSLTLAARPHHPGEGYVGIAVADGAWFQLPFRVEVTSAGIGGPSAGLAFTLGIIDELSSGDLTGGKTVAATGVMNLNGTVGDVGGVAQKTVAVRQAGASVFLVPTQEYRTAKSKAGPHLRVLAVANVAQALSDLEHLGGHVAA